MTIKDSFPNKDFALFTFIDSSPRITHSISLVIHILNALILVALVNEWFGNGWIVGTLFLINPLTIQAVAYGAGRAELLSLTGLLAFLWYGTMSYLNYPSRYLGVMLSIIIMLTTKVTIILVMPFLLIWVYTTNLEGFWLKSLNLKLFCAFLIGVLVAAPNIMAQVHSTITKSDWFKTQLVASWKLIYISLTGQGLSIDHPWWLASSTMQIVAIIAIIVVGIIVWIKKFSPVSFGVGWFWITIVPRLLTPNYLGWIREHHMYVPTVGICIALGSLLMEENGTQRTY